jgi:hypothetical protein
VEEVVSKFVGIFDLKSFSLEHGGAFSVVRLPEPPKGIERRVSSAVAVDENGILYHLCVDRRVGEQEVVNHWVQAVPSQISRLFKEQKPPLTTHIRKGFTYNAPQDGVWNYMNGEHVPGDDWPVKVLGFYGNSWNLQHPSGRISFATKTDDRLTIHADLEE